MDKDKENNIIIPTREEFEDFCSLKLGYNDREVHIRIMENLSKSWLEEEKRRPSKELADTGCML